LAGEFWCSLRTSSLSDSSAAGYRVLQIRTRAQQDFYSTADEPAANEPAAKDPANEPAANEEPAANAMEPHEPGMWENFLLPIVVQGPKSVPHPENCIVDWLTHEQGPKICVLRERSQKHGIYVIISPQPTTSPSPQLLRLSTATTFNYHLITIQHRIMTCTLVGNYHGRWF
jgi:hypothetical protein